MHKLYGHDTVSVNNDIQKPLAVVASNSSPQKCLSTKCSVFNGGCEDICLPHGDSNEDVKCECSQGIVNPIDKKRCQPRIREAVCNTTTEFECKSGECIPYTLTCDQTKHCLDGKIIIFYSKTFDLSKYFFRLRRKHEILRKSKLSS